MSEVSSQQNMYSQEHILKQTSEMGCQNENPLKAIVNQFTKRRQDYYHIKHTANPEHSEFQQNSGRDLSQTEILSDQETSSKPVLQEFLSVFESQVKKMNQTYKRSKRQFQKDMKSFKEADIKLEEDMIEKTLNETHQGHWQQSKDS